VRDPLHQFVHANDGVGCLGLIHHVRCSLLLRYGRALPGTHAVVAIIGKQDRNGTDFPFLYFVKFSLHPSRRSPNLVGERDRCAAFAAVPLDPITTDNE
jgi:hypothetical protein